MTDETFEQFVANAIDALPERFQKKLQNIAVVIADAPCRAQLRENAVPRGDTLLGLYEGIPLTERGDYYGTGVVLPDKITIFKLPIIEEAEGDPSRVKDIVRDTIWHEIAHYFGYDDPAIEKREEEGTNRSH